MKPFKKIVVLFALLCASALLFAGCDQPYYEKETVDSFVGDLENAIASATSSQEAKIVSLNEVYQAKIAELESKIALNQTQIELHTIEYTGKVAELEATDKANADALATLKSAYEAKIAELTAQDAENKEAIEALDTKYASEVAELEASGKATADALATLKTAYEAKIAELTAQDTENKAAIEALDTKFASEVAELEASGKATADALAALKTTYEAKVAELNGLISVNTAKIAELEISLAKEITAIKTTYDAKIANIENLITSLQQVDSNALERIAVLEAQVAALLAEPEHVEVVDKAVNPTCSASGLTEGKHCSVCGDVIVKQEVVPALAHTWSEWVIVKAPHCVEDGLSQRFCTVCNYTESKAISHIQHSYVFTEVVTPTNSEKITVKYTCSHCGDSYTETIIPTEFEVTTENRHLVGYTGESGENLIIPAIFENDGTWYRVTSIGATAFDGCSNLTSITIPDSVTTIREYAFRNCSSLTGILIPSSVTDIYHGAYRHCNSLTSIEVESGNMVYHSINNCLIATESKTLIVGCKNSIIPFDGSVTSIGGSAFAGCSSLTDITIPDSVTSIGSAAFVDCSNLTSITIPNSVTSIGSWVFCNCSRLTNITIPNSVTSIDSSAFAGCSILISITIPNSVTSIDGYAFSGCSSLKTVYYVGTESEWTNISIGSYGNTTLTSATRYYYTETAPTTAGNYWRYVDGIPTVWES